MSVAVLTDSTSDMSPALGKEYGVAVVPLWIVFGQDRLRDGVDITRDTFYARLAQAKDLPHTEPGDETLFAETFAQHLGASDEVVAVLVSGKLSKTYEHAVAAARGFGGRAHVVDSQSFSGGEYLQAMVAGEMARAGANARDIVAALQRACATQRGHFITPDLTYLGRSGRLNKAVVALGTVLKVNPVIQVRDGAVESAAQTRTYDKAKELLVDIATRNLPEIRTMRFSVGHAHAPDLGKELVAALEKRLELPPKTMVLYECGAAVAVHGGPGALAIFSLTGV